MTSNEEPSAKKQKIDEILTLNLPFPDTETRDTVYRVMIADKNPKKSQVDRQMYREGETSLRVEFSSTSLKSIGRVFGICHVFYTAYFLIRVFQNGDKK